MGWDVLKNVQSLNEIDAKKKIGVFCIMIRKITRKFQTANFRHNDTQLYYFDRVALTIIADPIGLLIFDKKLDYKTSLLILSEGGK